MAWLIPVTNRTAVARGKLDKIMLNRIEGNCEYLAGQLNAYGYSVSITVKTDWTEYDLPFQSEIDRIRDNINALLDAYHTMTGSPDIVYHDSLSFTDANSLEQNIKNIDTLLQRMIASFWRSGEIYGGER